MKNFLPLSYLQKNDFNTTPITLNTPSGSEGITTNEGTPYKTFHKGIKLFASFIFPFFNT